MSEVVLARYAIFSSTSTPASFASSSCTRALSTPNWVSSWMMAAVASFTPFAVSKSRMKSNIVRV